MISIKKGVFLIALRDEKHLIFFILDNTGKVLKMDKFNISEFLVSSGKYFLTFFCVLFGVIAQECYQILKHNNYKFKKIIPKLILAWFVCLIFGTFIQETRLLNKLYPILIMGLAFVHRRAADWLMNDFFKFILNYLNAKYRNNGK